MNKLGVALVGCGFIGNVHLQQWKSMEDVDLKVCVDIEEERAKELSQKYKVQKYYTDIEGILKDNSIDLVDVCTPTYTHREIVERLLESGKNVIVEKPISLKLRDAKAMVEKAKKSERKLMVAHVLRFWNEYTIAHELIKEGKIGTPIFTRAHRLSTFPSWVWRNWHDFIDKGGGVLIDMSIHDLDFLRWTFGEVQEVFARGGTFLREGATSHDFTDVFIKFKSGTFAYVEGSWIMPNSFPFSTELEVIGSGGSISFTSNMPNEVVLYLKDKSAQKISRKTEDPYLLELKAFKDAVKNDKEVPVPGEEGLKTLEVAIAGLLSVIKGKLIRLPLEDDFPF
ncbi:MAG: Gfo/Idh/MocA family oxidoreductase [Candidatus Brockarchaeota archaeon]|nr:Gfo/Idh/MocA family oxidoreductase [Candidatus Brockarchaeota archaeon]MBO3763082.1 Gfo/Idh/MocA family oxidoreductase [Candidatus Brockarchaeota archaeon]MBO3768151.1 Gfo/Idh/MocA family oxidoreductase [Candidatus Brockarchaeota archaeon]